MIPVLYPALERTFTNNGLGGLPNATSCTVTEKRNTPGGYYLEMDYPIDGLHYADIINERIIYASPAPHKVPQPFRIERISRPINGIVHVEAPHVSAEMQKLVTFGTYSSENLELICRNYIQQARYVRQNVPFEFYTDILPDRIINLVNPVPVSLMDVYLGKEGSVADVVGGEFAFDRWNVLLYKRRGVDTGIEIRYGVNMTDIESETDSSELVTAVLPYWVGDVNGTETVIIGDLRTSDNASAFSHIRSIPLDVSSEFDGNTTPTALEITNKGLAFIGKTELKNLSMSTQVKYTPTTLEIGDRPIYLCDTVRVVHPDLGVSSTAKVVEVKYNVLAERYDELTIGSIKQSIVDTIAKMIKKG